jgi:hypothetical protein
VRAHQGIPITTPYRPRNSSQDMRRNVTSI